MQRVNPDVTNGLWVIDSSLVRNIPLWFRTLVEGETFYRLGAGSMWEISLSSVWYCSEVKTAPPPKMKSFKKLLPPFSFLHLYVCLFFGIFSPPIHWLFLSSVLKMSPPHPSNVVTLPEALSVTHLLSHYYFTHISNNSNMVFSKESLYTNYSQIYNFTLNFSSRVRL